MENQHERPGTTVGWFREFEITAWIAGPHDSFSGGGLAGIFIGLPLGAILGLIAGFFSGRAIDRTGGIKSVPTRTWLGIILALALIVLVAAYMASLRPFYWIST